ncbi:MAG: ribosomal protein S18-alanine N-acetyltransferase [Deltaproteobacteria bacterium]|nr:ribosomal protein S18-alanine N-acetyltransferase [Deltaproteobacteria bacterium]
MASEALPPPCVAPRVRPVTLEDLDQVAALELESFSNPFARDALASELQRSWARVLGVDAPPHGIVAFVDLWLVADEVHVINVATAARHRRRGHARALLQAVLDMARVRRCASVLLEVRPSNRAAIALYERFGFAVIATRPRYYDDGEDALVMTAKVR